MRSWNVYLSSLVLTAACLAPVAASAAGGMVSSRGPRIQFEDRPPLTAGGRPVFVVVDRLAAFGDLDVASAPPLTIRVEGDAEITVLPDGSVRISFDHDDE